MLISFFSNLFFICVQLLGSFKSESSLIDGLYSWFSLLLLIGRTLAVCWYASKINDEARKPLTVLRSIHSDHFDTTMRRFCEQLRTEKVALTGMNFFYLTRKLILSVSEWRTKIISNSISKPQITKLLFSKFSSFLFLTSNLHNTKRFRAPLLHMSWSWFSLMKQKKRNLITIHALKTHKRNKMRRLKILSQTVCVALIVLILGRLLLEIHNGKETLISCLRTATEKLINLDTRLYQKVLYFL